MTDTVSSIMIIDEEERRVRDTLELYETKGIDISRFKQGKDVLLLNMSNMVVDYMFSCERQEEKKLIAAHLYDLARLGQESLQAQEMAEFIERSNHLLKRIIQ